MIKIQHVTDKKSPGILLYIYSLIHNIEKYAKVGMIEINDWKEISSLKRYDISHFHFSNSTRRILITLPLFKSKIKVVTIHDVIPRNKNVPVWVTKLIYRYLNSFSDEFIVHSEFAKKLLLQVAPFIPVRKVSVIYHGCTIFDKYDIAELKTLYGFSQDSIILSMIGFIKESKGQLEVISIFKDLNLNNVKLVIIGKPLDKKSESALLNLNSENIIYLGYLDDEKLIDYVKLSNALISYRLGSVGESSGPMLISIGAGKPIICSNVGSFPEIVINNGIIVGSLNDLKKAITDFCNNGEIREVLTDSAKFERYKYSWANISIQSFDLYNKLLFQVQK